MKKLCLSLTLIWSLLFTSIAAYGGPPLGWSQKNVDFQFAGVDRHPRADKSLDDEWIKILNFTSFGMLFFTPLALLGMGIGDNLVATQQLLGLEGLNKAVLECNEKKLTQLSSFLEKEGQDLFMSYLRATQTFTDEKGRKRSIQVLNEKDHMNATVQETREVVRHFIRHWKQKKQRRDSDGDLEESINSFLREFGYVVFSDETLERLGKSRGLSPLQMESLLLKKLYQANFLTKRGQIYKEPKKNIKEKIKKVFRYKKYAQTEAREKLAEFGFRDKEEQLLILHDLGFLGEEDLLSLKDGEWIRSVSQQYFKEIDFEKINPSFQLDWGKNLDQLLGTHLTYEYHLQEALDRLILESLVGQRDVKNYAKTHSLPKRPSSEKSRLHLLRFVIMDEVKKQKESATFLDLENMLVNIKGEIVKHFHLRNVQSKNFTILRVRGEDIKESLLTYIVGTGFITSAAASIITTYYPIFTFYLSATLQQNIALALAHVSYVAPWGLIVGGGVAGAMNLNKLIKHSFQYHQLNQDKGMLSQEVAAIDQQLSKVSMGEHDKDKLKVMKLFDLMDGYLIHKKQKLLFGNMEMDSLWLAISIVAASFGVVSLLALVGVVAASAMPYVGIGVNLFFIVSFLIYIILYMHEKHLGDDLLLSSKALGVYKQIYQMASDDGEHLTLEQQEFMKLCFQHVHRALSMAKYAEGITDLRLKMASPQSASYETMEDQFTDIWFYKLKMRYHAHKILKKEKKAHLPQTPALLKLVDASLSYQRNELDQFNLGILKPELMKIPLIPLHQVDKNIYLNKISETIDSSLMQMFTKTVHIYNTVKSFDQVYQKAYRQQELLKNFEKSLTRAEIHELLKGHRINDPKDLLMLYDGPDGIKSYLKNLTKHDVFHLDALYDSPIKMKDASSKEEIAEWKKRYFAETKGLIDYMENQYDLLGDFTSGDLSSLPPMKMPSLTEMAPTLKFYFEKWAYLQE